jgi:hypothetical protein
MIPEEHLQSYRVQKAAVRWGMIEAYLWLCVIGAAIYGLSRFVAWSIAP